MRLVRRLAPMLLYLILAGLVTAGVYWWALTAALGRLDGQGRADLALFADRLTGELQKYRELAVIMADHPAVLSLALGWQGDPATVDPLLRRIADKTGSDEILLADPAGRVLAGTTPRGAAGGAAALARQPHFRRAMQGALGLHHEIEARSGRRYFAYAAPVFSPAGPVAGALIVRVATEAIESGWRGEPMVVYFTGADGVAFLSNRDELTLVSLDPRSADAATAPPRRRLIDRAGLFGGFEIWDLEGGPYLPRQALHVSQSLPVIGMTGEGLVDTRPARRQAVLQAGIAAAIALGLGAVLYALWERRRALAVRLAAEEQANAMLETRVAARTRELSEANERLRRTQSELVQAGKLSALGQMSAGISHELNQPLMAIRSYAENAALFLERGQPARAAENLGRIGDLAGRMARIIRNLRAFARQEHEPASDVDLVAVVAAALELAEARLRGAGVAVDWTPPARPVLVRGGAVRLQQVVLNLLANAADAMAGGGRVTIRLAREGGRVRLSVADTGPGIAEPDRVFDPFYSTKEVGASEGMGLGLSISYGIVQSFGGAISGRNRPEGGAEFTVELAAARGRRAA
ncbi:sensor histidine kinase [Albidovulum sp.]